MSVEAHITEHRRIELKDLEACKVAREVIRRAAGWHRNAFIQDNQLMVWQKVYTSHSWIEHKKIRDATQADLAVAAVLELIGEYEDKLNGR